MQSILRMGQVHSAVPIEETLRTAERACRRIQRAAVGVGRVGRARARGACGFVRIRPRVWPTSSPAIAEYWTKLWPSVVIGSCCRRIVRWQLVFCVTPCTHHAADSIIPCTGLYFQLEVLHFTEGKVQLQALY